MKSEEKKSLTVRMSAIRLEEIRNLAKEERLSISDFIQMKCLDLAVEEKIIKIKKKRVLIEKTTSFHCPRCDRDLIEKERSDIDSFLCYDCGVEMDKNMDDAQEQPF